MNITARGAAVFSGVILATVALFGVLIDPRGANSDEFLLASWLPPIVLFPGAALGAALGGPSYHRFREHGQVLWPTYVGLVLYGLVAGRWDQFVAHVPVLIAWVQTGALLVIGAGLVPFTTTRSAGLHIWVACATLICCWVAGGFLV
jgi:hypothetical protein